MVKIILLILLLLSLPSGTVLAIVGYKKFKLKLDSDRLLFEEKRLELENRKTEVFNKLMAGRNEHN